MHTFRRALSFGLKVALIVALVLGGWLVWNTRRDPTKLKQQYLYEVATTSSVAEMDGLPKQHRVVIEPLKASEWGSVLISYLPPPIGNGGKAEMQGLYDPSKEEVRITGRFARLQASLADARLQPVFRHTLRHEYGHALLQDWSSAHRVEQELYLAYGSDPNAITPGSYPKTIRPAVAEYLKADKHVYLAPYFTATFEEYFAESYARYMDGLEVPPVMTRFLDSLAKR